MRCLVCSRPKSDSRQVFPVQALLPQRSLLPQRMTPEIALASWMDAATMRMGAPGRIKVAEDAVVMSRLQPETNNAPKDPVAVAGLPGVFPEVTSVMDFGGGVGVYLTGFRNKGVTTLVTVEPHSLGDNCLFAGIQQDTTDWINSPLSMLPSNKFDLVMSIEVVEHIPVQFHRHILQALGKSHIEMAPTLSGASRPTRERTGRSVHEMDTTMDRRSPIIGPLFDWMNQRLPSFTIHPRSCCK